MIERERGGGMIEVIWGGEEEWRVGGRKGNYTRICIINNYD